MSSVDDESVFVPPAGFSPPRWLPKRDRKHIPERGLTLEALKASSAGHMGDAWYDPRLSHAEIERIEMDTVRFGTELEKKKTIRPSEPIGDIWEWLLESVKAKKPNTFM